MTDNPVESLSATELAAHVRRRLGGRVVELCVTVEEAQVILRGRAATYYAKQLAQHAAMELIPVVRLVNEIQVG